MPEVQWIKDDVAIKGDNRVKIATEVGSTSLIIDETCRGDKGYYGIRVTNAAGLGFKRVLVVILSKPSAPRGPINFLNVTATSQCFSWLPPYDDGGRQISSYIVEHSVSDSEVWAPLRAVVRSCKATSTDLHKGKVYIYRVAAVNQYGQGPFLFSEPCVAKNACGLVERMNVPTVDVVQREPYQEPQSATVTDTSDSCWQQYLSQPSQPKTIFNYSISEDESNIGLPDAQSTMNLTTLSTVTGPLTGQASITPTTSTTTTTPTTTDVGDTRLHDTMDDLVNSEHEKTNDENQLPGTFEKPAISKIVPGNTPSSKVSVFYSDGHGAYVGNISKERLSRDGKVTATITCVQSKKTTKCRNRFRIESKSPDIVLYDYSTYTTIKNWEVVESQKHNPHTNKRPMGSTRILDKRSKDKVMNRDYCNVDPRQATVKEYNNEAVKMSLERGRSVVSTLRPPLTVGPAENSDEIVLTQNQRNKGRISRIVSHALDMKSDIVLPENKFILDEEFYDTKDRLNKIADLSEIEHQRILVLTCESFLKLLENSGRVSLDGTFAVSERVVYRDTTMKQCLTVSTTVGSRERGSNFNVCTMYLFLPDKRTETYSRACQIIRRLCPRFSPHLINVDFERAQIICYNRYWPSAVVVKCVWHHLYRLKKQMASYRLTKEMANSNGDFYELYTLMKGIVYTPIWDPNILSAVMDILNGVMHSFRQHSRFRSVDAYFRQYYLRTWIVPTAMFPPSFWAKPLRDQIILQTFNLSTSLSESVHAQIANAITKKNTNIRNWLFMILNM